MVDGDGNGSVLLSEAVPDGVAVPDKFKDKTVTDLLGSYDQLEKNFTGQFEARLEKPETQTLLKDRGFVRMPGEAASDEERAAFYAALGRPDKPEEYDAPDLAHEVNVEPGFVEWYRQTSHGAGLTKQQHQQLYADFVQYQQDFVTEKRDEIEKLGPDHKNARQRALNQLLPEGMAESVKSHAEIDPVLSAVLAYLGKDLSEDNAPRKDGGGPRGNPNKIRERVQVINQLLLANDPGYSQRQSLIQEKRNLFVQLDALDRK